MLFSRHIEMYLL